MAKKIITSTLLADAQQALLDKMKKSKKTKKAEPKKKMHEQLKELREEFKEQTNPTPKTYSEKYEEELRKSLFEHADIVLNTGLEEIQTELSVHQASGGKWDVRIDDPIYYFDPELSYEITGYRPINEKQGLDFDPTPFSEAAEIYNKTGSYTEYPAGSKPYSDF